MFIIFRSCTPGFGGSAIRAPNGRTRFWYAPILSTIWQCGSGLRGRTIRISVSLGSSGVHLAFSRRDWTPFRWSASIVHGMSNAMTNGRFRLWCWIYLILFFFSKFHSDLLDFDFPFAIVNMLEKRANHGLVPIERIVIFGTRWQLPQLILRDSPLIFAIFRDFASTLIFNSLSFKSKTFASANGGQLSTLCGCSGCRLTFPSLLPLTKFPIAFITLKSSSFFALPC